VGQSDQSIALLLTPPGAAAIAVVRLVGPRAAQFLRSRFSKPLAPGRCVHGELSDERGQTIDDPLVVMSSDGGWFDVNLHGGPWVVRSFLELAEREGFDVHDRLELPLPAEAVQGATDIDSAPEPRASATGRTIQREVMTHLPLAKTELALRELLRQPQAWEAFEQLDEPQRRFEATAMLADRSLWWLLRTPRIAIAGAPNVGKSTLANQLFAQERSITADLPGTTRDWVGEIANIDGLAVMLVDTPGIRPTADPIEAAAIERSAGELADADLVLLVLDGSRPLDPEQSPLVERFPQALRIVNKCDLPAAAWDHRGLLPMVATSGQGIEKLRAAIIEHFGIGGRPGAAKWWTPRQQEWLRQRVPTVTSS
jgi:tRNA modification GTPase